MNPEYRKQRAATMRRAGMTIRAIAIHFGICPSTVSRMLVGVKPGDRGLDAQGHRPTTGRPRKRSKQSFTSNS